MLKALKCKGVLQCDYLFDYSRHEMNVIGSIYPCFILKGSLYKMISMKVTWILFAFQDVQDVH